MVMVPDLNEKPLWTPVVFGNNFDFVVSANFSACVFVVVGGLSKTTFSPSVKVRINFTDLLKKRL